ncbi:MAG TPA: hemerythrin domain-containing protein [Nitrososphaerales archaeon]|nr:hemerythrin domain-containing protein [Nitrososphaerales archaeon]
MSYRLDYKEPIEYVIQTLVEEHVEFRTKFERIRRAVDAGNMPVALSLLSVLKTEILRHAVEEEAILARAIMKNARKKSSESVRILQEHRRIAHFFNDVLPELQRKNERSGSTRNEIREFLFFLENHHIEEQEVVFPLASGGAASARRLGQKGSRPSCRHLEVSDFRSYFVNDMYGNRLKVMIQQCSDCGAFLAMDGTEIPKSQIVDYANNLMIQ